MKTAIAIWTVALITAGVSLTYMSNAINSLPKPETAQVGYTSATMQFKLDTPPASVTTYQLQDAGSYNSLTDALQTSAGANVYLASTCQWQAPLLAQYGLCTNGTVKEL